MFPKCWSRQGLKVPTQGTRQLAADAPPPSAMITYCENTKIVWCDIQNLIKLSQRFGKATKRDVGKRVLRKEANVARVKPLSLVEVRFAAVRLTAPPCDVGERF